MEGVHILNDTINLKAKNGKDSVLPYDPDPDGQVYVLMYDEGDNLIAKEKGSVI